MSWSEGAVCYGSRPWVTIERHGCPIRRARSISTRAAQWLLGLREKGQGDTVEAWRLADIQTPSMGDLPTWLPCLQVIGGRRVE